MTHTASKPIIKGLFRWMYYLLYNIGISSYYFVQIPHYLFRLATSPSFRNCFFQRFGYLPKDMIEAVRNKRVIWVQAVSVGEVLAALPLISALRKRHPNHVLVMSTTTPTGKEVAEKELHDVSVFHSPLDLFFAVGRTMRLIKPEIIVLVENEIWPNMIVAANRIGVKMVLVSGRISERSHAGYNRFHFAFGPLLKGISVYGMQTEEDGKRILELGAPSVHHAGNLKFESALSNRPDPAIRSRLQKEFGLNPDTPVLICGSTFKGEEVQLIKVYERLLAEFPDLVLILAPRHPERATKIERMLRREGFNPLRRTDMGTQGEDYGHHVYLIDTVGELKSLYTLATLAFIGNSLHGGGGQNFLEPACLGIPTICGPNMVNFRHVTRQFKGENAIIQVADLHGLEASIRRLLRSPEECETIGKQARALIERSTGAVEAYSDLISQVIDP